MFDFFKRDKNPPSPQPAASSGEETSPVPAQEKLPEETPHSWRERLSAGLSKSSAKLFGGVTHLFTRKTLDDETLEELETALLTSDVGISATTFLLEDLKTRFKNSRDADVKTLLREALYDLFKNLETQPVASDATPFVVMLAGVNGAGKTTTIGKLAHRWQAKGKSILLAAGDTFRAAAIEQLAEWGRRNGVSVIAQQKGDPAAVMFDAVTAAKARGADIMIADTAGRLASQANLMEELKKIKRVIGRAMEGAPHETWLVLDANTGQNGLAQVKAFDAAVGLTGLVVTKLDGTAKGGVLAAIAREHPVPVRFIGVGEGMNDLQPFDAKTFVEALLP
jgi:fused signal recognition particle receptor